jgi:hypothetical protein
MGVSVHYKDGNSSSGLVVVAGQSEIETLWKPTIEQKGLQWLDLGISGGVRVNVENYSQVLDEISTMQAVIESVVSYEDDPVNPAFRCRRLHSILLDHPPSRGWDVYIG